MARAVYSLITSYQQQASMWYRMAREYREDNKYPESCQAAYVAACLSKLSRVFAGVESYDCES